VLRNDRVLGYFHPSHVVDGKLVECGEAVADYYPAILDEHVFFRAQEATAARKEPRAAGRKSTGLSNLFSGLGKCGRCGANLVFESHGNRRCRPDIPPSTKYLICGRALRHQGCDNGYRHAYAEVEGELLQTLPFFDISTLIGTHGPDVTRAAALEAEIRSRTATVDRLLEDFGPASSPGATRRIRQLEAEIAECEAELADHRQRSQIADANKSRDQHAEFNALVMRLHRDDDMPDDQRFLLRSKIALEFRRVIEVMEADGETLKVRLRAPSGREITQTLSRGAVVSFSFAPCDDLALRLVRSMGTAFEAGRQRAADSLSRMDEETRRQQPPVAAPAKITVSEEGATISW
jgi:hypothetical protein